MARGRKRRNNIVKEKTTKKLKHDMKEHVLDKICADLVHDTEKNNGRKRYGSVAKIVKEMKTDFPWMNRDIVNYALKVYIQKRKNNCTENVDEEEKAPSTDSTVVNLEPDQNKGGRPVGTTASNKLQKDVKICLSLNGMAIEYDMKKRG